MTVNTRKMNELGKLASGTSVHKQTGWIFINFKRYIINNILNSFEESVNVLDMRKQKIGETIVKV